MTTEENKAFVRRIYEELWDGRKLEVADEVIAEGAINYDTGLTPYPFGPEEMKGTVRMVTASLPDNGHEVEDVFAEGDQVMARVRLTGTHDGPFMGIPPMGRRIEVNEIHLYRLRDGKAVEHRVGRDDLGAMRQLGVIADAVPSPGPPAGSRPPPMVAPEQSLKARSVLETRRLVLRPLAPSDYLWNTTAILLGTAILVSGLVALLARLWEHGGRPPLMFGAAGLLVGTTLFVANLAFRYAVVATGASGLQAGVEDRAWVAHVYLGGLQGDPSWMELLLVWTDVLQLAFVSLAYLAAAAYGSALVTAGWLGKVGGLFVALNLALALLVATGLFLAGGDSATAAWLVFVLTIPFVAFILPYFLGLALIRQSGRGERGVSVRR